MISLSLSLSLKRDAKLVEGAGGLGMWGWVVYRVPSCQVVLVIISGTMKVLSDVDTGVIPRSLISWSFQ